MGEENVKDSVLDGTLKQNYKLQKETWRKERADKGANELAKFIRFVRKIQFGQIGLEKYKKFYVANVKTDISIKINLEKLRRAHN